MSVVFLIFSVVLLLVTLYSYKLKNKRKVLELKLQELHDRMRFLLVKENVHLNKAIISNMKVFSHLAKNPEFLDLKILILTLMKIEKRGLPIMSKGKLDYKKLPDGFKIIEDEFHDVAGQIVVLSRKKPDFIAFELKLILKVKANTLNGKYHKSRRKIKDAILKDEELSYQTLQVI